MGENLVFGIAAVPLDMQRTSRVMTGKTDKRKEPLNNSMLLDSSDAVLSKMGTDQGRQVLFPSLPFDLYGKKDVQIASYIIELFSDRGVTEALLNSYRHLQLVIETLQKSPSSWFQRMTY